MRQKKKKPHLKVSHVFFFHRGQCDNSTSGILGGAQYRPSYCQRHLQGHLLSPSREIPSCKLKLFEDICQSKYLSYKKKKKIE